MPTKKQHKINELLYKSESFWDMASAKEQDSAYEFCEDYKHFLNTCKIETQTIKECVAQAEANGFKPADPDTALSGGDKFVFINRGKSAIFVALGKDKLNNGAKCLLAHVDSPRLDLKVKPLYEDSGICYLKPHYYGGIKKYQWPTIPLSMIGSVVLKNGEEIEINIGEKSDDPVFLISDLLPHIDGERMDKPLKKAIEGEELNIIVGSRPIKDKKIKDRVKLAVLDWLNKNYKIKEVEGDSEFEIGEDYVLSPKDLCTLPFIEKLIESGVASFKIEGRNRSPEYVKIVTAVYRQAIDFYFENIFYLKNKKRLRDLDIKFGKLKKDLMNELKTVYNRGFSGGFYLEKPINQWARSYGSQAKEKKVYLGKVTHFYSKISVAEIKIEAGKSLKVRDEIYTQGMTTGVVRQKVLSMEIEHKPIKKAGKGDLIAIKTDKLVRAGDEVYKIN
ncbi:MAG: U32 family peptidase [Patescibacteria group bacterium]